MGSIVQDVRYGFRRLRRSPGFAATALLTLALGIGATTAIFTLVYQVMLKSMPVDHPEQLYKVGKEIECCVDGGMQGHWRIFSYDLYRDLRDHTPGIEGMAAVEAGNITVSAWRKGEPVAQPLNVRVVSGNYFSVLGVRSFAGRLLRPEDDHEGSPAVAVISYAIWQSKFHGDPSIVGETMMFTGHPVTIVGISAPGFLGDRNQGDPTGVWLGLAQEPILQPERKLYTQPQSHWLDVLVRIRDPKTVPAVESAIRVELMRWIRANRDAASHDTEAEIAKQTTELAAANDGINDLRDQYEKSLNMLQMIAAFVLVIACANLANLMLVRGVGRRQELSVRTALGASRGRLIREMLVESVVLSILGGALGLAVAYAGVKGMLALVMRGVEVNPLSASPSLPVLGFALGVSALTGVLFGIAPAFIASRTNPAEALRSANRTTGHVSGLQRMLVILQAALSVALLSTAGLLILSLQRMEQQDFHFQTQGRLIAFIDLQATGYRYEQLDGFYRQIDQTFAGIPGLHNTSYATYGPLAFNNWGTEITITGGDPNAHHHVSYDSVSPQYFDALGTGVRMGRTFTEKDTSTSPAVAVVNQTFVKQFFNGKNPIGMHFGPDPSMKNEYEIVGVVDDVKYWDPAGKVRPMFFTPMAQTTNFDALVASQMTRDRANKNERFRHFATNVIVRYEGDPAAATAEVRRALQQINPGMVIDQLTTYDDQVGNYFTQQRLVVRLTSIFGALALILASIGLYGVTAYGVARRVPEIGLRMALGANRANVVQLILRGAAIQVVIGLIAGIPLALLAGHFLEAQLYEVKGYSVLPLVTACVALVLSALIASVVPARRASIIEPMQALRTE
ncbi:ABC transporter permease [Edaphobacter albus]|uniref:ABC transporter permease n=1 Tax=Edaphobacter sp. 4G125 TaxID=2763071 RepID=UPI00164536E1|nr:ABC transporter permease [Edaphobacter sp. 4G125]QNI37049.1 ABC transporter permease [Edaphobacter sp. 4G125]